MAKKKKGETLICIKKNVTGKKLYHEGDVVSSDLIPENRMHHFKVRPGGVEDLLSATKEEEDTKTQESEE